MVDFGKLGPIVPLILLFGVMVSYSIPLVRDGVGSLMNYILGPLVDVIGMPFYIVILILASITGLYSSFIQKYTIDYERMQSVQARMKEFQKEYREAQLSQDEKKLKKLEARRDKMMAEQLEMSREQFKPMSYIMIVSVPIFFWLLFRMPDLSGDLGLIVLPYIGAMPLTGLALGPVAAWILWYMLCSLTVSQLIRKAMNIGGI
ncbi:MAG TPA: DUF106 domain-containing protein [Methanomicrobiales archaeon]|jgi:uncharacterized membrane protein (DUF106 family)|nr:DUF106 domain-containing protein [Methanomicrobiales archaeon]